jgi:hypothetical protein
MFFSFFPSLNLFFLSFYFFLSPFFFPLFLVRFVWLSRSLVLLETRGRRAKAGTKEQQRVRQDGWSGDELGAGLGGMQGGSGPPAARGRATCGAAPALRRGVGQRQGGSSAPVQVRATQRRALSLNLSRRQAGRRRSAVGEAVTSAQDDGERDGVVQGGAVGSFLVLAARYGAIGA